ncbi:MAG: hypothetical protein R3F56_20970 [Planctomycetota bacterium]
MSLPNDDFAVREVTFHEQVDIADEDYGDALDSFDLDGDARPPSATPALMAAEPSNTDEDQSSAQDGSTQHMAQAPRQGFFARLFGWLLGR